MRIRKYFLQILKRIFSTMISNRIYTLIAGVQGVGHAEDLCYLWGVILTADDSPDDPEDLMTRHRLLTLWSNFVKYL